MEVWIDSSDDSELVELRSVVSESVAEDAGLAALLLTVVSASLRACFSAMVLSTLLGLDSAMMMATLG